MIAYKRRGWATWHLPRHHGTWAGASTIFAACGKRITVGSDLLVNGHEIVDLCRVCEGTIANGRSTTDLRP